MAIAVLDLIIEILTEKYEVLKEELSPGVAFDDLALDSLALMEISLALEKKLGITIAEGVLTPQQTVGEAAEVLSSWARGQVLPASTSS